VKSYKSYAEPSAKHSGPSKQAMESNLDFLKNLTQKGSSTNNQNHHVNRSYVGVKNSKNYKAVLKSNEMMK